MQAGKEGPTFPDDCVLIDVADCIGLQPILFDNLWWSRWNKHNLQKLFYL